MNDEFVDDDNVNDEFVEDYMNDEVEGGVHKKVEANVKGFNDNDINFIDKGCVIRDDDDLYETIIENEVFGYTSVNVNQKDIKDDNAAKEI